MNVIPTKMASTIRGPLPTTVVFQKAPARRMNSNSIEGLGQAMNGIKAQQILSTSSECTIDAFTLGHLYRGFISERNNFITHI